MDLIKKYEEETGQNPYWHYAHVSTYSVDYVKWLEKQLLEKLETKNEQRASDKFDNLRS